MASTIKVNNFQSQCGSCGTITIGGSGDTVSLGAGASQSGFGRTGTVDWDTTAKTAAFTAVSGNGYFVNTTSAAITVTLPASPSAGDIVSISDYEKTAASNNITVARNGSNIDGSALDFTINTTGLAVTLIYVDATKGWKPINSNEVTSGPKFVTASGGTEVTCGDFKTHIFTGPGTLCVSCAGNPSGSTTVEYLVVGGGGSGGHGEGGGGGGAGGFRTYSALACSSPLNGPAALPVSVQAYPITVGAGGNGPVCGVNPGVNGSSSIFSTITSSGGGFGGQHPSADFTGNAGASGGGGGGRCNGAGGTGNTPPVSPPQGNNGGNSQPGGPPASNADAGGGGGGAGAAGGSSSPTVAGAGGNGSFVVDGFIGPTAPSYGQSPTPLAPNGRYFSGGGAGGRCGSSTTNPAGGGAGGGGTPPGGTATPGVAGTTNTGGGGGGGSGPGSPNNGSNGGSGIVMIRYKYQ